MRVGVLGLNYKLAGLELREVLARICNRRLHPAHSTHGEHALVLLSTCNRSEIYFSSNDLAETHSYLLNILRQDICENFDQKLYSYFGQDCLLHLARVTAGLDSAVVAETEIQGQVKSAYESAQAYHRLPYDLHYLFQKSLGIGKKARGVLPQRPGLPDLSQTIVLAGQHLFRLKPQPKILFVGASEINEKILQFVKAKQYNDITLCNRSQETGGKMALKYGLNCANWSVMERWFEYDWIICGTKAPSYLISREKIPEHIGSKRLVIDLSVPRNVDPAAARHPEVTLLNIDQLNKQLMIRRRNLSLSLDAAEELIRDATVQQMHTFYSKEQHRLRLCAV